MALQEARRKQETRSSGGNSAREECRGSHSLPSDWIPMLRRTSKTLTKAKVKIYVVLQDKKWRKELQLFQTEVWCSPGCWEQAQVVC